MEAISNLRAAARFAHRRYAASATTIPGLVLALYRVASGVSATEVANRLGVTKQRIANIERDGCPRDYAERVRAAVEQIAAER